MIVLPVTLDVHVSGVPISHLGGGLRPPVRPDAKLRVAKPLRTPVLLEGLPGRFKRSGRNRVIGRGARRDVGGRKRAGTPKGGRQSGSGRDGGGPDEIAPGEWS